jgi:uncharacterized protein (DUF362 family)
MVKSPDRPLRPLRPLSRRDFLRVSAMAAGGAAVGSTAAGSVAVSGCSSETTAPLDPTARVAAVRGMDLDTMTRDALGEIGGIGEVVHEGESVFIKPNMVTLPWAGSSDRFSNGECAKPDIIIAVAEECLKAGATEVVVGDGSQMPTLDWEYAATLDGSTNLVLEAERLSSRYPGVVRVASLETDSPSWVELPSRSNLDTIAVSSLVARADRVISIPVAKTHAWAQLTLSLKNFVGVTPLLRYGVLTESGYWDRGRVLDHSSTRSIAQIYLDVVAGVKPDLAVIDLSYGVEGDGPSAGPGNGATVNMQDRLGSWLVLASTDLVAADATAARIMSHDVSGITQLRMGYEMGLGEIRENAIEVVGESLADLRVEWRPARLRNRLSHCPFRGGYYAGGHRAAGAWA